MWVSVIYPKDENIPYATKFVCKVYYSEEDLVPLSALDSLFFYRFYDDDFFDYDVLLAQGFEERFPGTFYRELTFVEFVDILRTYLYI